MKAVLATILGLALTATVAAAQGTAGVDDQRGTFVRFDDAARVIVLDNGQMYRLGPNTVVMVNGQPVAYGTLQPGQVIVLRSAEPVTYRGGEYVALNPSGAPAVVVTSPASPGVVTAPPAATTIVTVPAAPAASFRQTIYGRVTDVDRHEIKVKTDRGSVEMPVPDAKHSAIREGDTVQLDITVMPGSSPAAMPRVR